MKVDAVLVECGERLVQRPGRDLPADLERVVAVHEHLGLDDRDDSCLLRESRVARQGMGVRREVPIRRDAVSDGDHRAPLREAGAEAVVLLEAPAEPVEALGDLLARKARLIVRAGVDLDPGDDALRGEHLREWSPVVGGLAKRLVVEDDAADVVLHLGCREEQLAVRAPTLFRRLHADGVEALLYRPGRLVGGKDALVVGDDRAGGVV